VKRIIHPARNIGGTLTVPGDKSIAHRAALLSILSQGSITITNFPNNADCRSSLEAAKAFGVIASEQEEILTLTPPEIRSIAADTIIDCGNSGTTARLLAGLVAGSGYSIILSGDESLSRRPMKRVVDPLSAMGAELFATDGHLPLTVRGRRLLPYEYHMKVHSAQVKSALLLAGLASSCSVTIREDSVTRDHTEIMIRSLGEGLSVRDVKPIIEQDPVDPRKKRITKPETFRREISLTSQAQIKGGTVDIPGDISTAAYFLAAAAIAGSRVSIKGVGLNPTRTEFLEHLKAIGCTVSIENRTVASGEPRGDITVTGGPLRARRIHGETVVELIDEIPIVAVLAAFAEGTTIIRDASELKIKESDRLAATAENLGLMGVKCGLLEDGLVIEGRTEPSGADFRTHGDHRIAMAFTIASLNAVGPSSLDDDSVVGISCPGFFELIDEIVS
jgi:3-phosphoshikimate 1-carboxyvinyltransferase